MSVLVDCVGKCLIRSLARALTILTEWFYGFLQFLQTKSTGIIPKLNHLAFDTVWSEVLALINKLNKLM
jgi:hypothetical protein